MLSTDGITNSNSDDDNYNFEEISQCHFLSILEIVWVFEELRRGGCFTGSIRYWNIAVVVGDSIYPGGGRGWVPGGTGRGPSCLWLVRLTCTTLLGQGEG